MLKLRKLFGSGSKAPEITLPVDLLDPGFVADPHATYAWLRDNAPLAPVKSGGFVMTRHDDIKAMLSSKALGNAPSRFSTLHARNAGKYTAASLAAHIPPFQDQPDHKLPRQALTRSFHDTFKVFAPTIPDRAAAKIAQVQTPDRIDLIDDAAQDFACQTIAAFVGLEATTAQIKSATAAFFRLFAPVQDAAIFEKTNAALDDARAMMAAHLTDADDTLVAGLRRFQSDNPALSQQHIVDNALLVLADGVENIEAGIAQVAMADIQVSEDNVRTVLASQTPAQIIPRVCREAFSMHGHDVAVGTPVFLALQSTNAQEPLTFGAGRHSCIGEQLGVAMIAGFARALQDSGAVVDASGLHYAPMFGHRWPRGVKVHWPT
ncbi:cytochrome P450 [Yoonia sp. 208BN28-4]|uniref:cytochrome P450 n=1 Tax=Yoonia sp. 208BN28-4 TaxID=3126505 RepID=UPI0030B3F654